MNQISSLLVSFAVLGLAAGGLAAILGAKNTKSTLLRLGLFLFLAALFIPYAVASLNANFENVSCDGVHIGSVPTDVIVPVVIGHVVLGIALLRRRLRGDRGDAARTDVERTRGRERPRLPPEGGE